ncbi:MAG: hypothetical protein ACLQVX_20620 [Limisphaerales bacterium]
MDIDNEFCTNGVAIGASGDYYSGPYGVEIWELNGATMPGNINSAANVDAYSSLSAYGFTLAATFSGQAMSYPGTMILGSVDMPGVTPAGGEVVLALAVWPGDYPSWSAAVSAGAEGGVVALVNKTVNYLLRPPPVPPDLAAGWDAFGEDLVMTPLSAPAPNTPPVLAALANWTVYAGSLLSFTASATDTDRPPQTLTFTLGPGAPAGASITAGGLFSWTPTAAQAPSTNLVTVTVTDSGVPPLSDSASFKVIVLPAIPPAALEMNNSDAAYGIAAGKAGNYYSGAYGLELWVLNGTNFPASINSTTNVAAHAELAAAGFTLAQTWSGQTMSVDLLGTLTLGGVDLPMVKPPGSDVVLALAAWSGDATNWAAAVAAGAEGGVIAFVNQTVDPSSLPPPVPPDLAAGWDAYGEDLVMTALAASAPNTPPVLAALPNWSVAAGSLLSFTADATDTDRPPQTLTFTLGPGAPAGASITAGGLFSWTPTAVQAPSTNLIRATVTDNGVPPLSDSASFTVVVYQPNTPPVLPAISGQSVNELTPLTVTDTATESNIHSTLGYALVNPPAGMTVSANGVITWTPQQGQSPSTNLVTVVATSSNPFDLVNPTLAATNTFTVVVREVNAAPILGVIGTQSVNELTLLTVTNAATESNIHSTLGYVLIAPPAGMTISVNGVITWTPQQGQGPSTNLVTTVATSSNPYDLLNPTLSATNAFTVIVEEGPMAELGIGVVGGQPHLTWSAVAGWRYQVLYKEALGDSSWVSIGKVTVASGDTLDFTDSGATGTRVRFYRIQVLGPQ